MLKRAEEMKDEEEDDSGSRVPLLERLFVEPPVRVPVMSLERLDESMG